MRSRHRVQAVRAAALLAALAMILVSCGGSGSPSTGASPTSGSPAPTATPRPTPALAFVLPEGALPPGAWATVTNGPVDLYGWPWSDSGSSGQLADGARVQIDGVPIVVDGHAWASVNGDGGGGYVPLLALTGALTLEPVTCPGASDLTAVVSLSPWERLSCFGGRELVLEGSEIVGFAELMRSGDPGWLNGKGELVVTPGAGWPSLAVHVPLGTAGLDLPSFDTELAPYGLRVTGHFNDPASEECRGPQVTIGEEASQRLADADLTGAELLCREQFVLTSVEVLGATPAPSTAPADDTVLLRVDSASDVGGPWPGLRFVVFADGRMVTASGPGSGWFERHLTDAARDELIRAALGEGLLQESASYPPAPELGRRVWELQHHPPAGYRRGAGRRDERLGWRGRQGRDGAGGDAHDPRRGSRRRRVRGRAPRLAADGLQPADRPVARRARDVSDAAGVHRVGGRAGRSRCPAPAAPQSRRHRR